VSTTTKEQTGNIFHTEFRSTDPGATRAFLSELFAWNFQDGPAPEYHILETPGGHAGHIGPVPAEDDRPSATNYVLVNNLDQTITAIETGGGRLLGARQDIPEQGSYIWFEAPGGVVMVAWQHAA
jgi:predicted enzyme related to lactoylglutathione lyase